MKKLWVVTIVFYLIAMLFGFIQINGDLVKAEDIQEQDQAAIKKCFETLQKSYKGKDIELYLSCYSKKYSNEMGADTYDYLKDEMTRHFEEASSIKFDYKIKGISIFDGKAEVKGSLTLEAFLKTDKKEVVSADLVVWQLVKEDGNWRIVSEKYTVMSHKKSVTKANPADNKEE